MSAQPTRDRALSESFSEELLRQMADPAQAPLVVEMLRQTNVLAWLSAAPHFAAFLHRCAEGGHADVLERASVAVPGCLDLRDSKGRSCLHAAARRGHLVTLNRLLDFGAAPRATTVRGATVLHVVATHPVAPPRRGRRLGAAQLDYLRRKAQAAATYVHQHSQSFRGGARRSSSHSELPSVAAAAAAEGPNSPAFHAVPAATVTAAETFSDSDDDDDDDEDDVDCGIAVQALAVTPPLARSWNASLPQLPPAPSLSPAPASTASASSTPESDPGALANAAVPKIEELIAFTVRRLCRSIDPNAVDDDGWTALRLAIENGNESVARYLKECGAQLGEEPSACESIVEVETPSLDQLPPSALSPSSLASSSEQDVPLSDEQVAASPTKERTVLKAAGAGIARVVSKMSISVAESSQSVSQSVAAAVRRFKQDAKTEYIRKVREIIDREPRRKIARLPAQIPAGAKYRIISLDGGGVRCVMHCIILARIAQRFPSFLDNTEMLCGCSGAAPIVVCLLCGLSTDQVGSLMELSSEWTLKKAEGNGITAVRYTSKWLRLMTDLLMGGMRLKDLPRHVLIPTYRLDNGLEGDQRSGDALFMTNAVPDSGEERAVDACLRSGSAPTYFRCYQGYVDGGVYANNPSMCALPLVVGSRPHGVGVNADNVVCLSLGTGFAHKQYVEDTRVLEGGLYQWGLQLLDVFNVAQMHFADVAAKATLGPRYFRHMPALPSTVRLDRVKSIPMLKDIASKLNLDDMFAWIEANWF